MDGYHHTQVTYFPSTLAPAYTIMQPVVVLPQPTQHELFLQQQQQQFSLPQKTLANTSQILPPFVRSTGVAMPSLPSSPSQERAQPERMSSQGEYQRVETYDLVKTLGAGAFGKVLLVRDRRNDKRYALKVLEKKKVIKMKQVEHTLNERNILAAIDFPFIVNMAASFKDQRNLYMVLEFVNAGELFTHLRKEDHFTESRTKFYACQVILALEYLHQKNIAHRDLKPENLLMDGRGYLKLADFGFAKFVEDRTFTMCGTPEYTAPEVIKRKGHNKAVDWWALGVLMYEMACGFTPFEVAQRDRMKMYAKILKGAIKYPRHFSENLCHLIANLLEVEVTKRFGCLVNGVKDIKTHPFFTGTDWSAIYWKTVPAPFIPTVRNPLDVSNFDQAEDVQPFVKTTTSFECPIDFPGF